jgi:hypothetical protein
MHMRSDVLVSRKLLQFRKFEDLDCVENLCVLRVLCVEMVFKVTSHEH